MGSESNGCPDSEDKSEIRTDIKPSSKKEQEGDSSILTVKLEDQKTKTESIHRNMQSISLHPIIGETKRDDEKEERKSKSKEAFPEIEDQIKPQGTMKEVFDRQDKYSYMK